MSISETHDEAFDQNAADTTGAAPADTSTAPTPSSTPSTADLAGPRKGVDGARHTRISGAWVAVGVAFVLGILLVDFIVQNTRSVKIEFFSATGHIPVAVALIAAALVGAFLVLAVGIARTTQLRLANRRGKKLQRQTESLVNGG